MRNSQRHSPGSSSNISISPTLKHVGGFLQLDINYGEVPSGWSDVNVTLESVYVDKVYSYGQLNIISSTYPLFDVNGDFIAGRLNTINAPQCKGVTIKPETAPILVANGDLTLYASIFQTELDENEELTITLTFSNGKKYKYVKICNGNDLERAKFYKPLNGDDENITIDYTKLED